MGRHSKGAQGGRLLSVSPTTTELPSALERLDEIRRRADGRRLAVFLDYDGTLTPIVDRPELAVLSDASRRTVQHLAANAHLISNADGVLGGTPVFTFDGDAFIDWRVSVLFGDLAASTCTIA